ncbi:MAG: hypothetical protein CSA34_03875 [Desulfobulbus propionicus]|nr:MAG: hypothetical protein CSA34_03875 [Desulfobulbus propionicus]
MRKCIFILCLAGAFYYGHTQGYTKPALLFVKKVTMKIVHVGSTAWHDVSGWVFSEEPVVESFHNKGRQHKD